MHDQPPAGGPHRAARHTTRRTMLGLTAAGAAGMLLPGVAAADETDPHGPLIGDLTPPGDVNAMALAQFSEVNNASTYYEVSGSPTSFTYDTTFYSRMETWLAFWYEYTPSNWVRPLELWSYGVYVNKPGYHGLGRAFDLTRIYAVVGGVRTRAFNGRYDQWRTLTGSALTTTRKHYWATSASLHYHFKSVLTYLYNTDHHNHIHLDNGDSGSGNSVFSTGSVAQTQHVQACCTYIWGYPTTIDGIWGPQTSANSGKVLTRIGRSGSITTQSNWLEFNRATMRFGTGDATY